ncbi:MAG: hypothetical protein ACFCUM_15965 [Bacteroidales bacterium]
MYCNVSHFVIKSVLPSAGNVEFIAWLAEWELYPLSYGTFWKSMGPLTGGQRAMGGERELQSVRFKISMMIWSPLKQNTLVLQSGLVNKSKSIIKSAHNAR